MKGAEAVISFSKMLRRKIIIKNRIAKSYRAKELDVNLRKKRTRIEARLLHKAKLAGVLCPAVLCVDEFSLCLSFVAGKRPKMNAQEARQAGGLIAKLHASNIIHGDFTPANLLAGNVPAHSPQPNVSGSRLMVHCLYIIDFGLGFFSHDIEDKAIDVYTMLKAINNKKSGSAFLGGYSYYGKAKQVFARLKEIEKRVRYAF